MVIYITLLNKFDLQNKPKNTSFLGSITHA